LSNPIDHMIYSPGAVFFDIAALSGFLALTYSDSWAGAALSCSVCLLYLTVRFPPERLQHLVLSLVLFVLLVTLYFFCYFWSL
jgi:hypothetical protein